MSSHPPDHVINHAGYRFEFYTDHTKVFALDDPTGMPLEAFPAVVAALAEPPTTPYPGKVVFPESTPRCATECDPLPTASEARLQEQHGSANAFNLWPTEADAPESMEQQAYALLRSKGYGWSNASWKWLRGDEDIVPGQRSETVTREVGIGELHKRLERIERILHENGVREA